MLGDPYIGRAELKSVLGITSTDEDTLVDRAIRGASRAIDRRSGYSSFWNTETAVTRVIGIHRRIVPVYQYGYYRLLLPDGIANNTGLVISGVLGATAVLPLRTGDPITELKLTTLPTADLTITAVWGWDQVPDDIIMATQFQAQRYYKRRGSPEGLAGSAEWGVVRVPRLDPDVAAILENGGYMNPGVG